MRILWCKAVAFALIANIAGPIGVAHAQVLSKETAPLAGSGLITFTVIPVPISDCDPNIGPVEGVVHMLLSNSLDLTIRKVRNKKGNMYKPDDDILGDSKKDGAENEAPNNKSQDPFHIFMKDVDYNSGATVPTTGKILVRIVIRKKSDWSFSELKLGSATVIGVTGGDPVMTNPPPSNIICGSGIKNNPSNRIKQVAYFYIDLAKYYPFRNNVDFAVPFNIVIFNDDYRETPIIIDPKIRNDG